MKSYVFKYFIIGNVVALFLVACNSKNNTQTEVSTLLDTSESWNEKQLPNYPDGKPKITILKAVIPPNTKLEKHKHSVINAIVVLKGELTIITEQNDTLQVKTGEAFSEVVDTWHYGINNGTVPLELIVFYAGIDGNPNTEYKKLN
jgi:quercetin dioxygenase-like cupin family protein